MKLFSDAFEHLTYRSPNLTPGPPHMRDAMDLKRFILFVVLALIPITFMSINLFGWRVMAVIFVSYLCGLGTEALFSSIFKKPLNEGALVSCLLYALILPPTLPLWMVGLGIVVAILFGKALFGGFGKNIFNPALVGRLFLHLAFPVQMTQRWVPPIEGAGGGFAAWSPLEETITHASPLWEFKSNGALSHFSELFWGIIPGSIGETSSFLILLCGLFLIATRVASWQIVLSTLLGAGGFVLLMNTFQVPHYPAPLSALLSGGLLFGAFFMATDPVTAPLTQKARWIYGFGIGILSMFIRYNSNYLEGVMFSILIMNLLAPLLDALMIQLIYKRRYRHAP